MPFLKQILLGALVCSSVSAAPITDLKPLFPRTELVVGGEARCVIVTAEGADTSAAAEALAARLEAAGSRPDVLPADRVVSEDWQVDHDLIAGRTLVALGNVNSNRLLAVLLGRDLVCSDSIFPGEGGYVIRTVHDPFATGVNVLVLAGSDDAGIGRAVDVFSEKYITGGDVVLDQPVVDIEFTPTYCRFYPDVDDWQSSKRQPLYSTMDFFVMWFGDRGLMDGQGNVLRKDTGTLLDVTGAISRVAQTWFWTGNPELPPLMKRLLDTNRHLLSNLPKVEDMGGRSAGGVGWWDVVEELPVWTDEDRLQITNALLADAQQGWEQRAANRLVEEGYAQVVDENHGTNSALNAFSAWQYFDRYYDLPESEYWMNVADATFSGCCSTHQILEDATGYLCYGPEDAILHALASGNLCYMNRGVARTQAEFIAQACVNNLGLATGFGDAANLVYPAVFQVLARAGWYYDDPNLLWVAYNLLPQACGLRVYQSNIPIDLTVDTAPPDEWNGMRLLPIYKQTVTKGEGRREPVFDPKEPAGDEWFNKIVFREAWDPDAQYLLLDGAGKFGHVEGYPNGPAGHRHMDVNTIPCFTDEGRMWLIDHTYGARAIKDHSGLYVTRDGALEYDDHEAKLLDFARGDRLNLCRSIYEGYSGATWERAIFWRVGDHFAVLDRAIADRPGHYVVRCNFRGLGEHRLDGGRMRLQQGDRFCHIVSDGLAATAVETFDQPAADQWASFYEHAEPVAKVFQQDKSAVLEAGESLSFANAFAASADESDLDTLRVSPVSESAMLVEHAGGVMVCGVGEMPGGAAEADSWIVADDAVLLAEATRVADVALAEATDLYLDASGLQASIEDGQAPKLTAALQDLMGAVLPEARRLAAAYEPPAARGQLADVPALDTQAVDLGTPVTTMIAADIDGDDLDEFLTVGSEGAAAFEASGEQLWQFAPGAGCISIDSGDIDGDGIPEIVVGCEDTHVYMLNAAGEELWRFECKRGTASLVAPPVPEMVRIADLEHDGVADIVVGANWTHCLTPSGEVKWEKYMRKARGQIAGDFYLGEIADFDADGDLEVLSLYRYSYHQGVVYGPGGEIEIPNDGGYGVNIPFPHSVVALNLYGHDDRGLHYIVGGNNELQKYHGTGEFVNTNGGDTGGCYLHMTSYKPAEGFPWVYASTDMGAVMAFRAEQERNDQWLITPKQWSKVVGERVTALEVSEVDGQPRLLVGTGPGALWALDATTGEPVAKAAPAGSPVVTIITEGSSALVVHADGTVRALTLN